MKPLPLILLALGGIWLLTRPAARAFTLPAGPASKPSPDLPDLPVVGIAYEIHQTPSGPGFNIQAFLPKLYLFNGQEWIEPRYGFTESYPYMRKENGVWTERYNQVYT